MAVPAISRAGVPATLVTRALSRFIGGLPRKPGDENARRLRVDLPRRADLLQDAAIHDRDAVGQRHRLRLIVGDVDRRRRQLALEPLQLAARVQAQLGVEIRERLVHQEDRRTPDDRPAQSDPLPLATGELTRLATEQLPICTTCADVAHAAIDLVLASLRTRNG